VSPVDSNQGGHSGVPASPASEALQAPVGSRHHSSTDSHGKNWRRRYWLILPIVVALGLRLALVPFIAEDFTYFFGPWSAHLRSHGLRALGQEFADYQPTYLYLLALTNLLPIPPLWSVKLIPMVGDFVLAYFVYALVQLRYPRRVVAACAGVAILFLPTVVLNSAVWGQCDVLFTTGLVASLYFLLKGNPVAACVAYGLAVSLKLQAVFFAPIILLAWVKGRMRLRHLVLIPAVHLLTLHPALYLGRSLSSALGIYFRQTRTYAVLQMGAPNLYQWIPNSYYSIVAPVGITVALAAVAILAVLLTRRSQLLDRGGWVSATLAFVLVMPTLLPSMHERYFFAADVFSVVFAFYFPAYFLVPVLTVGSSVAAYVPYLFGLQAPLRLAAGSLLAATAIVVLGVFRRRSALTLGLSTESELRRPEGRPGVDANTIPGGRP
jgi:Gpi18-like mannosyltransferase